MRLPNCRSDGSAHPAGVGKVRDVGFLRIDDAEALDDLEDAVAGLRFYAWR
jgi:hypothetical protein